MQGKLILTDIQSPVEGMQVVWADTPGFPSPKLYIRDVLKDGKVSVSGDKSNLTKVEAHISELKQIVVEYLTVKDLGESSFGSMKVPERHTLPLYPDDWKRVIEHIGEEVEFTTSEQCPHYGGKHMWKNCSCKSGFIQGAMLIHPIKDWDEIEDLMLYPDTPVMYTEEEVYNKLQELRNDMWKGFSDKMLQDWWKIHKKK